MNTFAANFNVNPNCVRVAVIIYADSPQASITLGSYGDINSLQNAVRSLRLINGNSNLASALQLLRNVVFASNVIRPGARRVAAIVTDNQRSCDALLVSEANTLRSMGVVIFGVAVTFRGSGVVNTVCLRNQVVTSSQLIEVPNYDQLNNYVSRAVSYVCATPVCKFFFLLYTRCAADHKVNCNIGLHCVSKMFTLLIFVITRINVDRF